MQMGFNNDVGYKGLTLHIQTEDHGLSSQKITSQVFVGGAILESKTISYAKEIADLADDAERDEHIRKVMKALHKKFYQRIHEGQYDDGLPISEAGDDEEPAEELEGEAEGEAEADAALDVPEEMLAAEGFSVAGEFSDLEGEYEQNSRGEPLDEDELRSASGSFVGAVDEMAAAASGIGHDGFVPLGGIGAPTGLNGALSGSVPAVMTTSEVITYGDTRCWRGLEPGEPDLGPFLLAVLDG